MNYWTICCGNFDWGIFQSQAEAEQAARIAWGASWQSPQNPGAPVEGRKAVQR